MSAERKNQAKGDQLKGKFKEAVGRTLGNERLEARGRSEQSKGDFRQAAEKVKDAFRR
ncbi:CsbD family protein [Streptomyces abyssalis]|uniref:CsbD family protein n=1 Tax=Streptomyces abyssalis TaxID=933944 RepID=UPI00085C9562|nr:CsbD family protein [Streptomyces abyssalis]